MENVSNRDESGHSNLTLYSLRVFLSFLRSRPSALFGAVVTFAFVVITILDFFYPQYLGVADARTIASFSNLSKYSTYPAQPPTLSEGWEYIMGTTFYKLPIFPLILASMATDIEYSFFVVGISSLIGTLVGVISAYVGKRSDLLVMRGTDIFLSIPAIIVVMIYSTAFGWNYFNVSISIIIIWWTTYARVARGSTLPLRNYNFVEAGIAAGCTKLRSIFSHIMPNIISDIIVQMTLDIGMVITIFATVNFLFSSLNITDAFVPEIGNLMVGFPEAGVIVNPNFWALGPPSTSILLASGSWWPIVIPGLTLILFSVGVNLFGDGLRDFMNPLTRDRS